MKLCFLILINQLAPSGALTLLLNGARHTDAHSISEYTDCFIEGTGARAVCRYLRDVSADTLGVRYLEEC